MAIITNCPKCLSHEHVRCEGLAYYCLRCKLTFDELSEALLRDKHKPATNPVYETMTRTSLGSLKIRVWRESPEWKMGPDEEVADAIFVIKSTGGKFKASGIVKALSKLPGIAAIEILDKNGNGGLFYPDWR
jgi:hypothetical protein